MRGKPLIFKGFYLMNEALTPYPSPLMGRGEKAD